MNGILRSILCFAFQEYLQNLRKIRLQNFNERRKLQADLGKNRVDHNISQEERKNKIKALRVSSNHSE